MLSTYVALLPGFFAYFLARLYSVAYAFLRIYLPVPLLLPDYYFAVIPGLPDPTFNQSASVILFVVFLSQGCPGYRFTVADALVAIYAFCVSYSEYRASGYSDPQNLMFFQLTSVVVPHLLAKSLIEPNHLRAAFAQQLVACAVVVMLLNLYENRFAMNLWQRLLSPFFSRIRRGLGHAIPV